MNHQASRPPLRFGLVGAGPWARMVHAPAIAAHPAAELVAVWARRSDAAAALAAEYGAVAVDSPDDLWARVDAVAFAVPPDVQASLASRAAKAGRHLVLEKPLGAGVDEAALLADAVLDAGVSALVLLTMRYAPEVVEWVASVGASAGWAVGTGVWVGGALLAGPFSRSGWRHARGALVDIGPHLFDLLEAGLGPVADVVAATHAGHDVWQVLFEHGGGARSSATMSIGLPVDPGVVDVTLFGDSGRLSLPVVTTPPTVSYGILLDDLVALVAGERVGHPCDVHRGLRLQRLIDSVERLALG